MIKRDVKIEPFAECQKRPGIISYGVGSYGYDVRCGYKFKVFSPICASVIDPKHFDPKSLVEVDLTRHNGTHQVATKPNGDDYCTRCGLTDWDYHWPLGCTGAQPPDHILIPPHSFALAESLESFTIPRDVLCIVLGKSTYARCGLIVNVTPGEPEWVGKWTIELSNTTPLPIKVYPGEGIMQCVFIRSDGYRGLLMKIAEGKFKDGPVHVEREFSVFASLFNTMSETITCTTSYADKKGKYNHQTGLTPPIVEGDKK